jgi:hypothetical protein
VSVFIPSCVAHITIKFDEALLPPDQLVAAVSVDDMLTRAGRPSKGAVAAKPSLVSKGKESFVMNLVPLSAHVTLPGYRQAGTFSLELNFNDLPIDPRTVRAAAIEIHLGTIDAVAFARGVQSPAVAGKARESVLDTRNSTGGNGAPDTLLIVAMIDKWKASHKGDKSTISMSGRDLRGALLDTPISTDPKASTTIISQLKLDQPIDELVAQILGFHPLYAQSRFSVTISPSEWPKGIPSVGDRSVIPRHKKGAKGKKSQAQTNSPLAKISFWDLIVQFCYFVGAIPLLNGTSIMLRPVRNLYKQQNAGIDPSASTPFLGGAQRTIDKPSGERINPLSVRRLVYGRDIVDFELERNFSGYQRPRVVRAIGHDPSSAERGDKKQLVAWWPPVEDKKAARTKASTGKEAPHEEVLEIPVPGVRDKDRLQEIARAIYEEIGRGEIGGNIVTQNLSSFGGDNADPDLLRIRPGDAVEIAVDTRTLRNTSPLVSDYTDHLRKPFAQRVDEIAKVLGDKNLAHVIVSTARGTVQSLQRYFRASSVNFDWNAQSGVKIDFDFQNYIEVRFKSDDTYMPKNHPIKRIPV